MANLFNLAEEYYSLMNEIESNYGEMSEETEAKLQINKEEVEGKVKAYYNVIRNAESSKELLKEEIERYQATIKSKESLIKRLKQSVSAAVDIFGFVPPKRKQKTLQFDMLTISNKETESVEILDTFDELIVEKEDYEKYYDYSIIFTMNNKDRKKLMEFMNINLPSAASTIKKSIKPKKDLIKEHFEVIAGMQLQVYLLKDEEIRNEYIKNIPDPIPGTYLNKNLTPQFK